MRGVRRCRRRVRADREVPGASVARGTRPLAAGRRCVARQSRSVPLRPAPLQHHRFHQLRPSLSVHLHRADVAVRPARHREHGFRDFPAALAGGGEHVPAAVVPSQRDERIHGPDPWRLRRQGGRLRARRREPAQLHERARAGRGNVRQGQRDGHLEAAAHRGHDGLHVRDAPRDPSDAAGAGVAASAARLPGLLGGPEKAFRSVGARAPMTRMNTSSASPDLYSHYTEWKRWGGAFAVGDKEARYFAAELRGIPLRERRVLEIGFGNGAFLAWAREQGAQVSGIEINDAMLEAAHRHGFEASKASLTDLAERGERYDVIAAFDVLEHWDAGELLRNFGAIRAMLTDGGIFLARFPNGQSP